MKNLFIALFLWLSAVACAAAPPITKCPEPLPIEWEYLAFETGNLPATLETLGSQGWELVQVELDRGEDGFVLVGIMKRPKLRSARTLQRLERGDPFNAKPLRQERRSGEHDD